METLSHKFIEALALPRDRLYGMALAHTATPAAAETALQQAVREVFALLARDEYLDVPGAIEKKLATSTPQPAGASAPPPSTLQPDPAPLPGMPADVWARLAASVQLEAAHSASAGALHPDSQLLQPDPVLAPKKSRPRNLEAEFDTTSPRRLLVLIAVALLVGLLITFYILTRPPGTTAKPSPAMPGTTPTSRGT